MSDVGLRLIGLHRSLGKLDEPLSYAVTGLTPDDHCLIGFGGIGEDGKRKWFVVWCRGGEKVFEPATFYDTPEDALNAVADLKRQGI